MPRALVKVVEDPDGHIKRRMNWAEIHQIDDPAAVLSRRDDAVARMRAARDAFDAELAGVTGMQAFRGDVWSVMHILWHVSGQEGGHLESARRIVEEGVTELPPFETRDLKLREALDAVRRHIDESIAFAERLTLAQLVLHARKNNREHYVVGILEETAEHFHDHLAHIRETKTRMGLPPAASV